MNYLQYPFNPTEILLKKSKIRKELLNSSADFTHISIAILGGSTTDEFSTLFEIFLLDQGIKPNLYESHYGQYENEALFPSDELKAFKPDIVYLHTNVFNITRYPDAENTLQDVAGLLAEEQERWLNIWNSLSSKFNCEIIQNNFEMPPYRSDGNRDGWLPQGKTSFVKKLNAYIDNAALEHKSLHINDIFYLSASLGLDNWFDLRHWYAYKQAVAMECLPYMASNLAAIIASILGKTKKCVALDLDNTLWGGVIGDDGVDGILLGDDNAIGEAYGEFQRYIDQQKQRGLLLAICSKNNPENALAGLNHPDSILTPDDFSAIQANWNLKPESLQAITETLGIGMDSVVFVDDNPAERALVSDSIPDIAVPEMGDDITEYIRILDRSGLFERPALSGEDKNRSQLYSEEKQRQSHRNKVSNYDDFLTSLQMKASIRLFDDVHLARITQLINKTNQYNLTTRRYTQAQVTGFLDTNRYVAFYGKLADKFGENGLVSVIVGEIINDMLRIDLWLMSCRVLQRHFEYAMFDYLCKIALEMNIKVISGEYVASSKNTIVEDHYAKLGFIDKGSTNDVHTWEYNVENYSENLNKFIEVNCD